MTEATRSEAPPPVGHASRPTFARVASALVLREMATTYGRSPGGYVWALLEPTAAIVVLSIGFSLIARTPPIGDSFVLFYATGMLVLQLYVQTGTKVGMALQYNKALLNYPAVGWFDAVAARFALSVLTFSTVTLIILTVAVLWAGHTSPIDVPKAVAALGLSAALGFGIGSLNAVLFGYFAVWRSIWGIVTRPLFIVSGVIFLYEDLPREVQDILWWNPLMHTTGLMRSAFYPVYEANYASVAFVGLVATVTTALGLLFLRQNAIRLLSV